MRRRQAGFTVVELLIATVVFSMVLVIITSGIIRFTHEYYRGVHQSSTQTASRNVMSTIAQNFQYGGGKNDYNPGQPTDADNNDYICIGDVQIDYKLGAQLGTDSNYGVFVSTVNPANGCKTYSGQPGRELLSPKMRLTNLKIVPSGNTYTITAGVAYGDLDLLCFRSISPASGTGGCDDTAPSYISYTNADWASNGATVSCRSGSASQFCAVAQLSTTVVARFESTPTTP
jgi:prepilin-type N-terminal cleavage/methylation domain-containing protein